MVRLVSWNRRCNNTEMWGWLLGSWCKPRKGKCWLYCIRFILNRKIGKYIWSKSIARRAGLRWMGFIQKIEMFKHAPRSPQTHTLHIPFKNDGRLFWENKSAVYTNIEAKVCVTLRKKLTYPSAIWWRINSAREYVREVQVDATLTGSLLWIPQGRMCRTELYCALT